MPTSVQLKQVEAKPWRKACACLLVKEHDLWRGNNNNNDDNHKNNSNNNTVNNVAGGAAAAAAGKCESPQQGKTGAGDMAVGLDTCRLRHDAAPMNGSCRGADAIISNDNSTSQYEPCSQSDHAIILAKFKEFAFSSALS